MFVVSEAEATAIRAAFEQRGEFAAAVELRRLFPGITDNVVLDQMARGGRRMGIRARVCHTEFVSQQLLMQCVRSRRLPIC